MAAETASAIRVTNAQARRLRRIERVNRSRALAMGCEAEEFDIVAMFVEDAGLCFCGDPIDLAHNGTHPLAFSLEHEIGLTRGGSHTRRNCRSSHRKCNCDKGGKVDGPLAAKTKRQALLTGQQARRARRGRGTIPSRGFMGSRPFPKRPDPWGRGGDAA